MILITCLIICVFISHYSWFIISAIFNFIRHVITNLMCFIIRKTDKKQIINNHLENLSQLIDEGGC